MVGFGLEALCFLCVYGEALPRHEEDLWQAGHAAAADQPGGTVDSSPLAGRKPHRASIPNKQHPQATNPTVREPQDKHRTAPRHFRNASLHGPRRRLDRSQRRASSRRTSRAAACARQLPSSSGSRRTTSRGSGTTSPAGHALPGAARAIVGARAPVRRRADPGPLRLLAPLAYALLGTCHEASIGTAA